MPERLLASAVVALIFTAFFWLIHVGALSWSTLVTVAIIGGLYVAIPRAILWLSGRTTDALHAAAWRGRQGRHHEFAGIALDVREDAQHFVWIEAEGLKRVMRSTEADDIFAARVASGRWQREGRQLWLRVDAVVQHLAEAPGRTALRRQRLRQWLQTRLLAPAQHRQGSDRMAPAADSAAVRGGPGSA